MTTSSTPSRQFLPNETVVLASHNKGKLAELLPVLRDIGVNIVSAVHYDLEEPEETEDNFLGNARIKAHFVAQATGKPAIADDSGLCIDALDGAPGVYTADWTYTPQGRDHPMAAAKIKAALDDRKAEAPYGSSMHTTIVVAWPDGHEEIFTGDVFGQMIFEPRGDQGFGFDPYFIPNGFNLTFAELDREEKGRLSHRMQAVTKMIEACAPATAAAE